MKNLSLLIDSYRADMVQMLCDLIRFPSVEAAPAGDMPFGKDIDDCLRYALGRAREMGLKTEYVDGYAGHADIGDGEKTMGILVHLDVVPPGEGWDTPPFEPVLREGKIYGRGANDNKVATVTSLFAIKACMEAGVHFDKKVRVIFGCDEESGWNDIDYYKTKFAMPDFGFSPDAAFPVINAEKGILHLNLRIPFAGDDFKIRALAGGERANVVCALVNAELDGAYALEAENPDIKIQAGNDRTHITARGVAAHGAKPELGVNAAVLLMRMLRKNGFQGNAVDFICDAVGDKTDGSGLNAAFEDEVSGKLSLNLGVLEKDGDALRAVVDIRYPVTVPRDQVFEAVQSGASGYGAAVSLNHEQRALYLPEDHFFVKLLLAQYRKVTGLAPYTIAIGGGTYARALDNAVAFGGDFPDPEGDDHGIHKQNEYVSIEDMVKACKVYANVIAAVQEAAL